MQYIGPYRVLEHIATGGAADVFAASGPMGKVAIKQCRSNEARSRTRFQREIAALRQLRHKSLVQVVDAGETDNPPWYAMEDLGRVSLRQMLRTERTSDAPDLANMVAAAQRPAGILKPNSLATLPQNLAITLIIEVGQAVGYAHSRGLIHRDLKPENIMMRSTGEAVVIDPGLVLEVNDDHRLTASGDALGTAAYMAPEQVNGKAFDERVDVFSLGQMLLELLGGKLQSTSLLGTPVHRMRQAPPLPKALYRIIARAVEEDPQWRYASMTAFISDLIRYRNGEAVLARPRPFPVVWWSKCTANPRRTALIMVPILIIFLLFFVPYLPQLTSSVEWRESKSLIQRFNTADITVVNGSWQTNGSFLEATQGGSLLTSVNFPSQVNLALTWTNQATDDQSLAIECMVGAQEANDQGWLIQCYHDGLIVLKRHGKPWWYRKFSPPDTPEQRLHLLLSTTQIQLRYQDEPKCVIPIISGVPAGHLGVRIPEGLSAVLNQWTVRVPKLAPYVSSLDVVQNLIADAEVSPPDARQALIEQALEMLIALTPITESDQGRQQSFRTYLSWLTYAYNIQLSQGDTKSLQTTKDLAGQITTSSPHVLAYLLAMGSDPAFVTFRDMALKDPNFDAKAWSDLMLPLSPSNLDDYWWAIWTLIHRNMPQDDPQRVSFQRIYGVGPF